MISNIYNNNLLHYDYFSMGQSNNTIERKKNYTTTNHNTLPTLLTLTNLQFQTYLFFKKRDIVVYII